jgi:hypothetical protein
MHEVTRRFLKVAHSHLQHMPPVEGMSHSLLNKVHSLVDLHGSELEVQREGSLNSYRSLYLAGPAPMVP